MFRQLLNAGGRILLIAMCTLAWKHSFAQTSQTNATCSAAPPPSTIPLSEVHTVAAASQATPVECTFNVQVAGSYQVTLTDLGTVPGSNPAVPSPLTSVKLSITSSNVVVGTPLTAPGTLQLDATGPGTYVIHVVGVPGTQLPGSGPIGISVKDSASNTVASFSATLSVPQSAPLPSNESTLDDSFTVSSTGTYTVTLSDLAFPQALTTLELIVTTSDGTIVTSPPLTANGATPVTSPVTLQTGVTYRIFAVGLADPSVNAGLFSASVAPSGGGAAVYTKLVAVGRVAPINSVSLAAGSSYTLKMADLSFPSALASLAGLVVQNGGQVVAQLAAGGTSPPFTAVGGTYGVYALASPSTSATVNAGSYTLTLAQQGGANVLSVARAVGPAGGTPPLAYSYDVNVATGGAYAFNLSDFGFLSSFALLQGIVVQNGAQVGQPLSVSGTENLTLAAGPLSVLVIGQPGSAGSLFGVDLGTGGTAAPIFAATQGVGALFSSRQLAVSTAGNYAVSVSDVGFPAKFAKLAVVVTQGSSQLGSIYGGGAFAFSATPGNYFVNFIATPGGADLAGTYSLKVTEGPSVSLQSDNTTVASGATVHLTWSTQNTTSCTASGGWSGSQSLSGTFTTPALTTTTTFTLTCSGAGVDVAKSVTVNVDPPPATKSGGGGSIDLELLAVLALLVAGRLLVHRNKQRPGRWMAQLPPGAALVCACTALLAGCGGAQSRLESHVHRGQAYFEEGNYTKASVEFRNALQIDPKDSTAQMMAGHTAEHLGQFRAAIGLYQSVVDSHPDNVDARASLARLFTLAGAPDRARDLVEPAIAKHPDDIQLLTTMAMAKLGLKDEEGARTYAEKALKLAPSNEDAVALRAGLYRRNGDLASAAALVEGVLQRAPSNAVMRELLMNIYTAAGESLKAEQQLKTLIALKPAEVRYRNQLASLYTTAGRLDDAQHVLEESVKAFPQSDTAKFTLVDFMATRGSVEPAMKILQQAIAHEPDDDELRLHLGAMLARAGRLTESADTYNELIRRAETKPSGLLARDRLAAMAVTQQRYDEASRLVSAVLEKSPRDSDALSIRGQIALVRHDPVTAIADFRAVLRDHPRAVTIQRRLARAYVENGEPELAVEVLRAAQEAAPTDVPVRIELAQALLSMRRVDDSVKLLEEGVRATPSDVAMREALVRAYIAKRDFVAASKAAEDIKTLRPESATGPYLAGLAAQGAGQLDDAEKEFKRAMTLQPKSVETLSALAKLHLARKHPDRAIQLVKDVADHDSNAFAWNLLGELYLSQQNLPSAREALSHAAQLSPTWWVPYRNLALERIAANDMNGAIAAYERATKAAPSEASLVIELAGILEKQGRIDDAIARYEQAYKANPHNQLLANNLAMMLVTHRSDRASMDQARELTRGFDTTTDGNLLDTKGWVHFKRAEYADALPTLERAAQQSPDSRVIHYHLGMAELQSGRTDRARSDLQTALSGAASFEGVDEARSALASLKSGTG